MKNNFQNKIIFNFKDIFQKEKTQLIQNKNSKFNRNQ